MLEQTSNFMRTNINDAKMGAYYTDLCHCRDIGKMFQFPAGGEVCVLEPSIGDGSAVITVTGAQNNPGIKIFGVELNDAVAKEVAQNPLITDVLTADFRDVMIRRNSFSFAFGNPPYLKEYTDMGSKARMERIFLDKIVNYLTIGAILVWVVPENAFFEDAYLKAWARDFDTECIYRFRKSEYEKYHQIVCCDIT